jgi:hypothetical protein
MVETKDSQGWKFYEEQIKYLYAKDTDGLVDSHYHEDGVIVSFDFTVKGREALREHFRNYLEMLGDLRVKSTDRFTETEDTIFFEATVETSAFGEVKVYDAFILKDGKITYHFTGVK